MRFPENLVLALSSRMLSRVSSPIGYLKVSRYAIDFVSRDLVNLPNSVDHVNVVSFTI